MGGQASAIASRMNTTSRKFFSQTLYQENDRCIDQKETDEEDVCPTCWEKLLKKMLLITSCRYSHGNNVHITCMKTWPDHQDQLETDCSETPTSRRKICTSEDHCRRI